MDEEFAEFQAIITERLNDVLLAMANVDALIVDASYTQDEYLSKKGWGHGTYESAMMLASHAHAKRLFFTHHEPHRTDDVRQSDPPRPRPDADLDAIHERIAQENAHLSIDLIMAREGDEVSL